MSNYLTFNPYSKRNYLYGYQGYGLYVQTTTGTTSNIATQTFINWKLKNTADEMKSRSQLISIYNSSGNGLYSLYLPKVADGSSIATYLPEKSGTLATTNDVTDAVSVIGNTYQHVCQIDDDVYGTILVSFYSHSSNAITTFAELRDEVITVTGTIGTYIPASGLITEYNSHSGSVQWLENRTVNDTTTTVAVYISNDSAYDIPIEELNFTILDTIHQL